MNKIVVIGAGNVGSLIMHELITKQFIRTLVLIDVNKEKTDAICLDLMHANCYQTEDINIVSGTYEDAADADIVIITAGIGRKPGQSREELYEVNANIIKEITTNLVGVSYNGKILVVTNPCERLALEVLNIYKQTDLVYGSGTVIDEARYNYLLANKYNTRLSDVDSKIVGVHGDDQKPDLSKTFINGKCALEIDTKDNLLKLFDEVKLLAPKIIKGKGYTSNAIASSVVYIIDHLLDENTYLSISKYIDGEFIVK